MEKEDDTSRSASTKDDKKSTELSPNTKLNFLLMNVTPDEGGCTQEDWVSQIKPYINNPLFEPDFVLYQEDTIWKDKASNTKIHKSDRIKDILNENCSKTEDYDNCYVQKFDSRNQDFSFDGIIYKKEKAKELKDDEISVELGKTIRKDRFKMVTYDIEDKTYLIVSFHGQNNKPENDQKEKGRNEIRGNNTGESEMQKHNSNENERGKLSDTEKFNILIYHLKYFQLVCKEKEFQGMIIGGDFNIDINDLKDNEEIKKLRLKTLNYVSLHCVNDDTFYFFDAPFSQLHSFRVKKIDDKKPVQTSFKETIIFSEWFQMREFGFITMPPKVMEHPMIQVTLELKPGPQIDANQNAIPLEEESPILARDDVKNEETKKPHELDLANIIWDNLEEVLDFYFSEVNE